MLTKVKGTQDILDTNLRDFLFDQINKHLITYNFFKIITPTIEKLELFQRTVGAETDIVKKEMFTISAKKEEIVLRPEITAPVMRAFLNNKIQILPWQVFTIGPAFRHERPQKGRYREFYQVSIEAIGISSAAYDAYFMTMLDRFFSEKLNLDTYVLAINFLGCPQDRKIYKGKLYDFLTKKEKDLCENCKERKETNILRVLDCKNKSCQEIYKKAPIITDFLCSECEIEWDLIQKYLSELSVSYIQNPMLVRGLDYYNKIIFEFFDDSLGAQSTFCGGGRYDTIATQIGSKKDYPSIGAALGVERILLLLEKNKNKISLKQKPALVAICPFGQDQISLALQVGDELHANNICAQLILDKKSLKSILRKANDLKSQYCILIGPEEQKDGHLIIKNMTSGEEKKIVQSELTEFFFSCISPKSAIY